MAIRLTKTEELVFAQAMLGLSTTEMSEIFEVRPDQISRHLRRICRKKGVETRAELMAQYIDYLEDKLDGLGIMF